MKAIWVKNERETKNSCYSFCLKADKIEKGDILRVAALNIYSVYLDGKFKLFGPEKTSHGRCAVDELPLGEYAGSVLPVVVMVTGYNVPALSVQMYPPFFSAEIVSADGRVKYTTQDFSAHLMNDRVKVINKFSHQRHFCEYYVMKQDRTAFYNGAFDVFPSACVEEVESCELVARETHYPTYDTKKAVSIKQGMVCIDENAPVYYARALQELAPEAGYTFDSLERCLSTEVEKFVLTDEACKEGMPYYEMYDLGANLSGFFRMRIKVSEKAKLYLIWDEILTGTKLDCFRMSTVNAIGYDLDCGEYDIVSVEPYTARYCAAIVSSGKATAELDMILLENPDAHKLCFSCEDNDYVKIIDAARATFAQNCVDIPTDCPSRERAGWLCDSYFTARAEILLTGANTVEEHHLTNYAGSPQFEYFPKGVVTMCYPGDFPSERYIPNWAMWYIVEIADNIKRTGSSKMAEVSRSKVKGLIEYFKGYENELGLLEKLDSWVFVEWSRANDFVQQINFPSNMLYCATLRAAATILNDSSLNEKADKLKNTIREMAMNGIFFVDNANRDSNGKIVVTDNMTETCQYYAFYFNIATPETDTELFSTLLNSFGATRDTSKVYPNVHKSDAFIGNFLRLGYLSENGYAEKATAESKDYFLYMADRTGTLWEHDATTASCNHGFASYATNIVIRGLTGFDGIDVVSKSVRFVEVSLETACEIKIPIPNSDEYVEISVKDKKRQIKLPDGYRVVGK